MSSSRKLIALVFKFGLGAVGLIFLVVVGLIAYIGLKQHRYSTIPDTRDLPKRIDAMAAEYLGTRKNGGLVIGVIQRGKRFIRGYGRVNDTDRSPPDGATLFEIGSITKVFTAVTLAGMALDGKVRLNDPISLYLPKEVTNRQLQQITLGHLATHTSGLPRLPENFDEVSKDDANPYLNYRATDLYDSLNQAKPNQPPGKKSDYSNLGYGLLGHILELRAGKPYERLVEEWICLPLAMTNTAIHLTGEQKKRLSPGHNPKGEVVSNWDFDVLAAAGAFRSNADDLLAFVAANLTAAGSQISKSLQESHKKQFESWDGTIGLGWQITETMEGLNIFWHNGGTGGYVSFIGFDPEHRTGMVILSNYGDAFAGDDSVDKMSFEILKLAAKVSLN